MIRICVALLVACAVPATAGAASESRAAADEPVVVIGAPRGSQDLRVQLIAPRRPQAGGRLALRVIVTNPSDAPMSGVRVRLRLPVGLRPRTYPGGRRRGRSIVWNIRHIAPGRSRIRTVRGTLSSRARSRRCAVVRARGPNRASARRCMLPRSVQTRQ